MITLERFVRLTRIKITRKDWKIVLFNFHELETANNRRNNLKKKSDESIRLFIRRVTIPTSRNRAKITSPRVPLAWREFRTRASVDEVFSKTGTGGTLRKKRRNWAKQS